MQRPAHEDVFGRNIRAQFNDVFTIGIKLGNHVVAIAQTDPVGIGTRTAFQHVITGTADQQVIARAADQCVVSATAHDHIIAPIEAAQLVVLVPAQEHARLDRLRIPHRAIGKNDFLHREAVALVEMVLDDERLASVAEGELQVIADLPAVDRAHPLQPHIIRGNTRLELDAVGFA